MVFTEFELTLQAVVHTKTTYQLLIWPSLKLNKYLKL